MSIVGTAVALNLFSSPVMAGNFDTKTDFHEFYPSRRIAQITIGKYSDGIRESREELSRLIHIVRNHPKLSDRKKAEGVFKLYMRKAGILDDGVRRGIYGKAIREEDKLTIINRWKAERDEMVRLANQEIEPYLTARERKVRAIFSDPAQVKLIIEQGRRINEAEARARRDADALRGIIPEN